MHSRSSFQGLDEEVANDLGGIEEVDKGPRHVLRNIVADLPDIVV